MLFYVLFCFLHHRLQHDVRIADNLSKSVEVMKVVTCFVHDEFSKFCPGRLKCLIFGPFYIARVHWKGANFLW